MKRQTLQGASAKWPRKSHIPRRAATDFQISTRALPLLDAVAQWESGRFELCFECGCFQK